MNRRDFIRVGLGSLTLPQLLQAQANSPKTSVVMLYLSGGISHIETFDPKPEATSEFRGVSGAIGTNVDGIQIGSHFKNLSRQANRIAIVRSFSHENSGHSGGSHWVYTGRDNRLVDNGGSTTHPSFGAVLSRYRGPNSQGGLPSYVKLGGAHLGDGASFIGGNHSGFEANDRGIRSLTAASPANENASRRTLRRQFDSFRSEFDRSRLADTMDGFEQQAFDLLYGSAVNAFSVEREPDHIRKLYGGSSVGQNLLLARRLCEAGVGVVTVQSGGWDMHSDIERGFDSLAPAIDKAISAFVEDIHQRGLQNEILLVVTGEFGRTPRINQTAGRDHWPQLSTLMFSGGGLKMGQVIGESTSKAERPNSKPVNPADMHATIYRHLGIPHDLQYRDQSGRPVYMNDGVAIEGL